MVNQVSLRAFLHSPLQLLGGLCVFSFSFWGKKVQNGTKSSKMFNYATFPNFKFPAKNLFATFPVKLSILVKSKMAATFDDIP